MHKSPAAKNAQWNRNDNSDMAQKLLKNTPPSIITCSTNAAAHSDMYSRLCHDTGMHALRSTAQHVLHRQLT